MKTSTATAGDPRRRLSLTLKAAALAAALLLPAWAPAAPSLPAPPPTAAASPGPVPDGAPSPLATSPDAARSPADIPVRSAAPPAAVAAIPAPTSLTVAGTSINMTVVPVAVSAGGAMEIPDAFDHAGWYRFGPAPGATGGTAVIAGHIDTTSERAPFSQLKTLSAGTAVQVGRQGAPALNYRVIKVELMAKDSFDGDSLFRRSGPHELKMVTCGGKWLDDRMDYSDNVIVTAVPE